MSGFYYDPLRDRGKILDLARGSIVAESDPGNCNGTESDVGKRSERRFAAPSVEARFRFAGSIQLVFAPFPRRITPSGEIPRRA